MFEPPMIIKRLAAALFFFCLSASAFAQQQPPYVYPVTLGTSSVSIVPANTSRKKLIFHNPNAAALVAVCPVGPSRMPSSPPGPAGAPIVASINGAGCSTLLPYQTIEVSGSTASGPQQQMPSAWVGIASAGGSALTVLEFE
jgi:hypothetical protein